MGTYTKSWNESRVIGSSVCFFTKNQSKRTTRQAQCRSWPIIDTYTSRPAVTVAIEWRGGARLCARIMGLLRCAVILKASARLTLSDLFNWYISARPAHAQRLNTLLSPLLTHYSTTSSQTYHLTGLSLFFSGSTRLRSNDGMVDREIVSVLGRGGGGMSVGFKRPRG